MRYCLSVEGGFLFNFVLSKCDDCLVLFVLWSDHRLADLQTCAYVPHTFLAMAAGGAGGGGASGADGADEREFKAARAYITENKKLNQKFKKGCKCAYEEVLSELLEGQTRLRNRINRHKILRRPSGLTSDEVSIAEFHAEAVLEERKAVARGANVKLEEAREALADVESKEKERYISLMLISFEEERVTAQNLYDTKIEALR